MPPTIRLRDVSIGVLSIVERNRRIKCLVFLRLLRNRHAASICILCFAPDSRDRPNPAHPAFALPFAQRLCHAIGQLLVIQRSARCGALIPGSGLHRRLLLPLAIVRIILTYSLRLQDRIHRLPRSVSFRSYSFSVIFRRRVDNITGDHFAGDVMRSPFYTGIIAIVPHVAE